MAREGELPVSGGGEEDKAAAPSDLNPDLAATLNQDSAAAPSMSFGKTMKLPSEVERTAVRTPRGCPTAAAVCSLRTCTLPRQRSPR